MIGVLRSNFLTLFLASWIGMAIAVTCPLSTSSLTDASRDKILNTVNRDRELIRRGELLLGNGQYALQGAFTKNLTWDCNVEVKLFESVEAMCNGSTIMYTIFDIPYMVSITSANKMAASVNDYVDTFIADNQFNASTMLQLQTNTTFADIYNPFTSYYLSDVGTTIACAAIECLNPSKRRNYTQLLCKTSPSVDKNEFIYIPGSPETVTTPAPQPSCTIPDSLLTAAHRERITWDCEMEARMNAVVYDRCAKVSVSPTRNESSWHQAEIYN
uniref:SCP domain-containing protein n=1 Tax=Panagrolaimus sp. ES5 TaxID=591445 RepID=A0AC34GEI4_9BILA